MTFLRNLTSVVFITAIFLLPNSEGAALENFVKKDAPQSAIESTNRLIGFCRMNNLLRIARCGCYHRYTFITRRRSDRLISRCFSYVSRSPWSLRTYCDSYTSRGSRRINTRSLYSDLRRARGCLESLGISLGSL